MFYGTESSYIEFPNNGNLDTQFSITLMCWVQPGGEDGPLFSYGYLSSAVSIKIELGKFLNQIVVEQSPETSAGSTTRTTELLPAGEWVHVAASYDHNNGNNSLYINGHLKAFRKSVTGSRIDTAYQRVHMGAKDYSDEYFKGKIAEMKVYNVALNEAQIQTSIRQGSCTFFRNRFLITLSDDSFNQ